MIISGVDMVTSQKRLWPQARAAREWFAENGPTDAPALPLDYDEREALKHGGLGHIVAWYARSLAGQRFDWRKHPSFYDYACGVMASEHTLDFVRNDQGLQQRFPPRLLRGLDPGLDWNPPNKHARIMENWHRSMARLAASNGQTVAAL